MKKKQFPTGKSEKTPNFDYMVGRDSLLRSEEFKGMQKSILESRKKSLNRTGGKPRHMMSEFYF